jgi:hypothetical protein
MDQTHFARLKQKLISAKQFDEIWNYFFDQFSQNEEFMSMGHQIDRHELLEVVLAQVASALFKVDAALIQIRYVNVPEHKFIHGCGKVNGHLTSVIYFEDVQVGIFNVVGPNGRTDMARFSGRPFAKKTPTPSLN